MSNLFTFLRSAAVLSITFLFIFSCSKPDEDRDGIWSAIDNGTWQTSGNSLFLSQSETGFYVSRAGNLVLSNDGNTLSVSWKLEFLSLTIFRNDDLRRTSDVIVNSL